MYHTFLFNDVLHIYRFYFSLQRFDIPVKNAFYKWEDLQYRNFVMDILKSLVPRLEERNTMLFNNQIESKEGMNEVLLIWEGKYKIIDYIKPESTIDMRLKRYCIALRSFKPH